MSPTPGSETKSMEGCVMLALSSFRKSEKAIDLAMEKSREVKKLSIVYVADVNLARYLIGAEHGLFAELRDSCEEDLLEQHEKTGWDYVAVIAEKAYREGIEVKTHVEVGRFGVVCLEAARIDKPSWIVTTRSKRPDWVKRFFGAPVDDLITKAECPVSVV
jgi:nucleotide-binding universal stress UspA family protein